MDELHEQMARQIREVHDLEYQQLHPDIENILTALCGPVDSLTGLRDETQGMKGQINRIELDGATMRAKVDDLHSNGRLKLSRTATTMIAALVTGIFAILAVLLQHAIGG